MPHHKLLLLLAGLALLAAASFFILRLSPPQGTPSEPLSVTTTTPSAEIKVTAKNGKFTPETFYLDQFERVILEVTAADRDYFIRLPDWDLDLTLPQGTATRADITALGVGTLTFDCGGGCQGTFIVSSPPDEDAEDTKEY